MTLNFGVLPVRSSFTLSGDADFYQQLRTADGSDFPGTAALRIDWLNRAKTIVDSWSADVTGPTALFREDSVTVATLLAQRPVTGRVFYMADGSAPELLLVTGDVRDISP